MSFVALVAGHARLFPTMAFLDKLCRTSSNARRSSRSIYLAAVSQSRNSPRFVLTCPFGPLCAEPCRRNPLHSPTSRSRTHTSFFQFPRTDIILYQPAGLVDPSQILHVPMEYCIPETDATPV
ncbi:hypothetical protein BDW22DRAFT_5868 [Trametopsis cervina]|nr:hypothetical protein BDW22DRAFT_5868 [Trametopsis cervina]